MTLELADLAAIAVVIAAPIGLQTFWISRAIARVEHGGDALGGRLGALDARLDAFRAEVHRDMVAHTKAITDLRERVARLEA